MLEAAFKSKELDQLPRPPIEDNCWPPSGMESLGDALQWASKHGEEKDHSFWNYYLGVWFAGRGEIQAAIDILDTVEADWSYALKGRMFRVVHQNFEGSREHFRKSYLPHGAFILKCLLKGTSHYLILEHRLFQNGKNGSRKRMRFKMTDFLSEKLIFYSTRAIFSGQRRCWSKLNSRRCIKDTNAPNCGDSSRIT